ncbi:class I SAM-dependent methyltransferase [Streptomyces antibioticus]|uniref:class I SAM-dependent methyltransferase n=1 Tax=Streptomyces antibioticus TaxID=1890 RepID=UPI002257BD77|nr:class I SAM-dependent methyltransferase [Streptomyces antibioticus]MCX4742796.1 class I SAM-dependent methyltransferase [Streptomyces antibioticus]
MNTMDQKWSKVYDGGKDFRPLFPIDLEKVFALLPHDQEKKHLDIGCGTGGLTRDLFHRGYTSTGIDPSSSAIERAEAATLYLGRGIDYVQGTFESVDLTGRSYSLITCKLVYAFLQEKKLSLEKVRNLLSSEGAFVLVTKVHDSAENATPISVDHTEVRSALIECFGSVQEFDLEWAVGFVCQPKRN